MSKETRELDCKEQGKHHSSDRVLVYYGTTEPLYKCGYHAMVNTGATSIRKAK